MDTEVHVLHRMDHNVYELHAGNLQTNRVSVKPKAQTRFPSLFVDTVSRGWMADSCTYHEVNVAVITDEILHQLLKAALLSAHLKQKYNVHGNMQFDFCSHGGASSFGTWLKM